MYVLNTLVPLLALITLGAALRRWNFAPPSFFREANRLLYWIAMPALLFYQTAEATIQPGAALRVFLTLLAGMVVSIILGYLVALLLRLPRVSVGAFVQGAYRSNLAYVGLPVVLLSLAASHGQPMSGGDSLAVLSIAFLIPVYNLTAVVVLLAGTSCRAWGQPHGPPDVASHGHQPARAVLRCRPALRCFRLEATARDPPDVRHTGPDGYSIGSAEHRCVSFVRLPALPDRAYERCVVD